MIDLDGEWADPRKHRKCTHCGRGYKSHQGTGDHCCDCAAMKFGRQVELGEYAYGRRPPRR